MEKIKDVAVLTPPPLLRPLRPFNLTKFHFKILEQCDEFVQSQQRHYNEIKMISPYHQMMPLLLTFDKLQFFYSIKYAFVSWALFTS